LQVGADQKTKASTPTATYTVLVLGRGESTWHGEEGKLQPIRSACHGHCQSRGATSRVPAARHGAPPASHVPAAGYDPASSLSTASPTRCLSTATHAPATSSVSAARHARPATYVPAATCGSASSAPAAAPGPSLCPPTWSQP
jgi:hypothetical protein